MPSTRPIIGIQRNFYSLAMFMMAVAALYWGRSVLLPLALATLFAFILTPVVSWLERHHFGRVPAVLVVTLLVFGVLFGLGYGLTLELGELADKLPQYRASIQHKIDALREQPGTVSKLIGMFEELPTSASRVNQAAKSAGATGEQTTTSGLDLSWLTGFAGSAAEMLADAALVFVLAIFILIRREDLRDRLIKLLSRGHLTATTRALDEAGDLISRYLSMLVLVNACYGMVLALGLYVIGIPFALFWGFLAATLRFIPYLGIWIGAAFPILLSAATGTGWVSPLLVLGLILILELIVANAIEPVLYGRSMGVSEVALLVSAAFWRWLWGAVGLALAVPLTICLAVLGKYVPQLAFFGILLRDRPALPLPTRYYQRLLAHDEDEALEMVEEYLAKHPGEKVFDEVLMPALSLARRDQERGELDAEEQKTIYHTTREVLDDLIFRRQQPLKRLPDASGAPPRHLTALAFSAYDEADELSLHMLAQLLEPSGCHLEVLSAEALTGEMIQKACEEQPLFVVIGALPPRGLSRARNLCKRLRAECEDIKLFVLRWGQTGNRDQWRELGAEGVAGSLQDAVALLVPLVQALPPGATGPTPGARAAVAST